MKNHVLHPFHDLNYPLLYFTDSAKDAWTISDAVRGTQIFGGIGSGKSSSSGRQIAKSMLSNGFGGLVLCSKPDEKSNWVQYAKETGREKSLKILSEHGEYRFNFLDYEMNRPDGGGLTRNISNLFMNIYEMGQSGGQKNDDRFWDAALKRMLNRIIDLLKLAEEKISIENMTKGHSVTKGVNPPRQNSSISYCIYLNNVFRSSQSLPMKEVIVLGEE